MTRNQERTLSMLILFINATKKVAAITATIPTFPARFSDFEATVNEIRDIEQLQSMQMNTLNAKAKKDLRMQCFTQLRTVWDSLNAFAIGTENEALEKQVSMQIGKLKVIADTTFATQCETLYNIALPLATDLVAYGIPAPFLPSFRANIDTYLNIISAPRENIINRADNTKKLAELFTEAKAQLTKLTKLAAIKRTSDASFYNKLIESTKIVDLGSTPIALRVSLKDQDGLGARGFTFTFSREDDGKVFEYKTNDNGTIVRQFFKDGAYAVTASRIGFIATTSNIIIEDGITYKLEAVVNMTDKTISF